MRDLKVEGDLTIGGNFIEGGYYENSPRLLVQCSNEQLLNERPFRKENVRLEQKKKVARLKPLYFLSTLLFTSAAVLAWWNGKADLMTLMLGLPSIIISMGALKATLEPNAFQRQELRAVAEINLILRQRRVE